MHHFAFAAVDEAVDDLLQDIDHPRLDGVDAAGVEDPVGDPPIAGVRGRIGEVQRMGLGPAARRDDVLVYLPVVALEQPRIHSVGEGLRVDQHRAQVVVSGDDVHPRLGHQVDRGLLVQRPVELVGVVLDPWVQEAEVPDGADGKLSHGHLPARRSCPARIPPDTASHLRNSVPLRSLPRRGRCHADRSACRGPACCGCG